MVFQLAPQRTVRHTSTLSACDKMRLDWVITDANGKIQEVTGDGVVGMQPHLNPGETFRYSSGAVLDTPVGSMYGSYHMLADNGADFNAPIAPFTLAVPGILH